jgi:hypothetical protein
MISIPSKLIDLGRCVEVQIETPNGEIKKYHPGAQARLCCPDTSRASSLWVIIVAGRSRKWDGRSRKFEAFHGFEADTCRTATVSNGGTLRRMGKVFALVYRSKKWTGKDTDYIHHFKKKPWLSSNSANNPGFLKISGGNIRIRSGGITG